MPIQLRNITLYGLALAAGGFVLQWLDYQRLVRSSAADLQLFMVGAGFLGAGVWLGLHVLAPKPSVFDGNPQALASLGISPRELEVLRHLAAGASNKQIARSLGISPNTIKTHLAKLFEKLGASRRTEAVARARELGLIG